MHSVSRNRIGTADYVMLIRQAFDAQVELATDHVASLDTGMGVRRRTRASRDLDDARVDDVSIWKLGLLQKRPLDISLDMYCAG
jgi:hypothetical protein